MQVGIDTGGTFTDFVYFHDGKLRIHKVPSTPHDPSKAIISGLIDILGREISNTDIVHGTTVATNALLERKGARIALVTTKGFEDVIEIGRQNRGELYNIFWRRPEPLVEAKLRFGISERTRYDGRIDKRAGTQELEKILRKLKRLKIDGIAVSLLHSYANPANEKIVAAYLESLRIPVSVSSVILPEFREFERTSTVVTNSYLLPKVKSYMSNLTSDLSDISEDSCHLSVMQSSGGIISPEQAGEEPVRILLSGPAGGVVGGFKIAGAIGHGKVITYDMGGTSTDVSLCDGALKFSTETSIDGIPIKVPMIDVTTIGAGGGSIAYVDSGGALKVGPKSAGADPGPACYGKGALLPTVTDANVVLGRIKPSFFLGGRMKIYPRKSISAVKRLSKKLKLSLTETADGIIKISNVNMERALRVISIGRGYDPRDFALLSFGGGGGLHACELALQMEINKVIFPMHPGVLSALGMIMADSFKDYSVTVFLDGDEKVHDEINSSFKKLRERAISELGAKKIKFERYVDVRYKRQAYEITVPYTKNFIKICHRTHKKMYGYNKPADVVEVVTLRVRAIVKRKNFVLPQLINKKKKVRAIKDKIIYNSREFYLNIYERDEFYDGYTFLGPSIVLEETSTIFIPPGFKCEVDGLGNILASI